MVTVAKKLFQDPILLTTLIKKMRMKRIITLLLFLLPLLAGYAQNPFAAYGYKPKMATLSNGRFDEFHDKNQIVEIGSIKFDTKTNKIVGLIEPDTLNTAMDVQTVSRFVSIDPHAERYYSISPYAYCFNNPIRFIDPDGQDGWDVVAGYGIGIVTNIIPGSGGLRDSYAPNDPSDYNNALQGADYASVMIGDGMIKTGGTGAALGAGAVAVGVTVTAGSGGTLAIGGVPVAGAGVALIKAGATTAGAGAVLMANGKQNQEAGYNRGKKNISETKVALKKAKEAIGLSPEESLPKNTGKFGSPQRGDNKRGYRLDPAHPNAKEGSPESQPHINYWDYTQGKRGNGGIEGAIPIIIK